MQLGETSLQVQPKTIISYLIQCNKRTNLG